MKIQRNALCQCFSGKKYKHCCLASDQSITYQQYSQFYVKQSKKQFIIRDSPELEEYYNQIGEMVTGENAETVKIAKEKIHTLHQLHPNDEHVQFLMGLCHILEDNTEKATYHFKRAIDIYPYCSEAYLNLGIISLKNGDTIDAATHFRTVLKFTTSDSETYQSAQNHVTFIEEFIHTEYSCTLDQFIQVNKIFDRAVHKLTYAKFESAITLFEKVLTITPNHYKVYGNMGLAYSGLGKNKIALEYLDKALAIEPTYQIAVNNRKIIAELPEGELGNVGMSGIFRKLMKEMTTKL